ncbi:ABC transporter substrate-binding protein [Neoactinobaculum massilliense]|uniref:ABC transporter substrate-binding protein n=1 Tax=Neoactinobaculum massilliense TaxID=2364794 RepID=UPI000F52C2FA|nr:ABC transporter substrate-binding protein [Neoactinobaculum massilliense]
MPRKMKAAATLAAALALTFTGCASTGGNSGASSSAGGATMSYGTTMSAVALDPAGSYDDGSFMVQYQVFPLLFDSEAGGDGTPKPNIVESAKFTSPNEYTVKLKPNLKFVNGHALTASDVKFSFDRMLKINDPNGPASLLAGISAVEAPDDTTAVFTTKTAYDQTIPGVLVSPSSLILDEEVFPADRLATDQEIIEGKPYAGQYSIDSYKKNELVSFSPNSDYQGLAGVAKNAGMTIKYYADTSNMKLDIENGAIDAALRTFSATDLQDLSKNKNLNVTSGAGGEIRYITFNLDTMPYGAKTAEADADKAKAVRQAIADSIDRKAIASDVFKDTYIPLYSFVPDGVGEKNEVLKEAYGDGQGGPDADRAAKRLSDAGVATPVEIKLQYTPEHYGPSSGDEYAAIKQQLEDTGLFKVDLQSTEWVQYTSDRADDAYPLFQLGWFPDFPDPDNYLTPFFSENSFLLNHYDNAEVRKLLSQEVGIDDQAERTGVFSQILAQLTDDLPTLPLQQGEQAIVSQKDVKNVKMDISQKYHLGAMYK